jgi:hypothetical protein
MAIDPKDHFDVSHRPAATLDDDWYAIVIGRDARPFTIGARFRLIAIAIGVIVALNLYAPGGPNTAERLLASAIIAACFLPIWLWMDRLDRAIPFMVFIAVFYAFYYAVPVFLLRKFSTDLFKSPLRDHAIVLALAYSLLGLICMYAGYYGILSRALGEVAPRFSLRWRDPRVVKQISLLLAALGIFLSSATMGEHMPDEMAELLTYAGDFSLIGICVLMALQLSGKLDVLTGTVLWTVLIPLRFFSGMSTGSLGTALAVGLTVIMIYSTIRRKIPWLVFAVGITFIFVLRPVEIPYRMMTGEGGVLADASASKRMLALGDLLYRATLGGAVSPQVFVEACASRLAQFTIFAAVVDDTPGTVPYWNGTTYIPLLTKLIPRAVWADKPEEMSGREFGHRYDLISWENRNTSVNLPQLVECYANFGVAGVIVGMFVIGLAYRMLISLYVHPGMGLGAVVGAVYVSSKLLDIGTAASMVFGGLPWAIAAMAIFHLVIEVTEIDLMSLVRRERPA